MVGDSSSSDSDSSDDKYKKSFTLSSSDNGYFKSEFNSTFLVIGGVFCRADEFIPDGISTFLGSFKKTNLSEFVSTFFVKGDVLISEDDTNVVRTNQIVSRIFSCI